MIYSGNEGLEDTKEQTKPYTNFDCAVNCKLGIATETMETMQEITLHLNIHCFNCYLWKIQY